MTEKASKTILVGVAIGVLSTIGGKLLIDWIWSQPEASLKAKISFGSVAMPPVLPERLAALQDDVGKDAIAIEKAKQEIITTINSDEFVDKISNTSTQEDKESARKLIRKQIAELLLDKRDVFSSCQIIDSKGLKRQKGGVHEFFELLSMTRRLSVCWEIEITNEGNAKAEEISIDLPQTEYAVVLLPSVDSKSYNNTSSLPLGSLGAKQSLRVLAWTLSDSFLAYSAERIVVRHSKGVAKVVVNAQAPIFWKKIAEISWVIWLFLTAVFGSLLVLIWFLVKEYVDRKVSDALDEQEGRLMRQEAEQKAQITKKKTPRKKK